MESDVGFGLFGQAKTSGNGFWTPLTWQEVERGVRIEDFTMLNVPQRVKKLGDLWEPLLREKGRVRLERPPAVSLPIGKENFRRWKRSRGYRTA